MRRQSSLEFDDLRTIIALAEELNFHRAGRRVGLSQPGVTRVLAKVERHVGACLFERSHSKRNSVVINDAGRSYVERAKLALAHEEGAALAARETMHGIDRQLVVGRSPHVDRRLVEILHSIELPLYPNLRVDLKAVAWIDYTLLSGHPANGRLQCERRQAQLCQRLFTSEVGAPANELSVKILMEANHSHIVRKKLRFSYLFEYEMG